jgi:hypothetical protein
MTWCERSVLETWLRAGGPELRVLSSVIRSSQKLLS